MSSLDYIVQKTLLRAQPMKMGVSVTTKRRWAGLLALRAVDFFETFWICQSDSQKTGFIYIGHGKKLGALEAFVLYHRDGSEVRDDLFDRIQTSSRNGHVPGPRWPVEPDGDGAGCGWSPAPGECLEIACQLSSRALRSGSEANGVQACRTLWTWILFVTFVC